MLPGQDWKVESDNRILFWGGGCDRVVRGLCHHRSVLVPCACKHNKTAQSVISVHLTLF